MKYTQNQIHIFIYIPQSFPLVQSCGKPNNKPSPKISKKHQKGVL